jgi:hypothetical protein
MNTSSLANSKTILGENKKLYAKGCENIKALGQETYV